MRLRPASPADADLLVTVLALAADWRPGTPVRSPAQVLADPALARYVVGWPRPGDGGVVATADDGAPLGAAWWRRLPADAPGYGFVREDVPEVSLAVLPGLRGRGTGTALLQGLVAAARAAGLAALSLSVERDNPAVRLYGRTGFVEVAGDAGAATMLLDLSGTAVE